MFDTLPVIKPDTTPRMIGWWELRRIVYNVVILVAFFAAYVRFCFLVGPHLAPGEHPIAPMAVVFVIIPTYFVVANLCYTFCWIAPSIFRLFSVPTICPLKEPGFWGVLFAILRDNQLAVLVRAHLLVWQAIGCSIVRGYARPSRGQADINPEISMQIWNLLPRLHTCSAVCLFLSSHHEKMGSQTGE